MQYHSCRHRSCPLCNALPKEQWVQKQFQRLLATDHYHVIFTVPHELLLLWRYNQRWFADTQFRVVSETLMTLAKEKKHLGAIPGMILSLHTWGRNLSLHPHIHCLITGGGLSSDGTWRRVKHDFLFPARVVRALYRGKFLSALWQGLRSGELHVPPHLTDASQGQCFKQLARKKWNVRIQPPYSHGQGVMKYLARYVKGGPISNHRITQADHKEVSFVYKDHRDGQTKTQRLSTPHFIERVLDHIAEPRQHVIRHYGLYGHQAKAKRQLCRQQLGQPDEQDSQDLNWTDYLDQQSNEAAAKCKRCGKQLVRGVTVGKNSIYKVWGSGYVQPAVQADISTWQSDRHKPPERPVNFFGGSMPLN